MLRCHCPGHTAAYAQALFSSCYVPPLPLFRVLGSPRWNRHGHDEPTARSIPAFWQGIERKRGQRCKEAEMDIINERNRLKNRHKYPPKGGGGMNARSSTLSLCIAWVRERIGRNVRVSPLSMSRSSWLGGGWRGSVFRRKHTQEFADHSPDPSSVVLGLSLLSRLNFHIRPACAHACLRGLSARDLVFLTLCIVRCKNKK